MLVSLGASSKKSCALACLEKGSYRGETVAQNTVTNYPGLQDVSRVFGRFCDI